MDQLGESTGSINEPKTLRGFNRCDAVRVVVRGRCTELAVAPSISEAQSSAAIPGTHQLWGLWTIALDPVTMTADIKPLRGVQFTCNVTQFMQPPSSPVNMISLAILSGSDPNNGYFKVDVTLKHPFPGMNLYRGFDVKGILIAERDVGVHPRSVGQICGKRGCTTAQRQRAHPMVESVGIHDFQHNFRIHQWKARASGEALGHGQCVQIFRQRVRARSGRVAARSVESWELPSNARCIHSPIFYPVPDGRGKAGFHVQLCGRRKLGRRPIRRGSELRHQIFSAHGERREPYCISVIDNGSTAYYQDGSHNGGN